MITYLKSLNKSRGILSNSGLELHCYDDQTYLIVVCRLYDEYLINKLVFRFPLKLTPLKGTL